MPDPAGGTAGILAGAAALLLEDLTATVVVDGDARVVYANAALLELTGWTAEALLGRPLTRLVATGAAGQVTVVGADGATVAAVATRRALPGGGAGGGAVVTLAPAGAAPDPDDSGPSAIEVVSTVSHELRSPLTSVKGYTSLLLNRWDRLADDQKQVMLQQVNHDADRVVRLITELLDISRLETGRLVLRRQLVDLPALATAVVAKVGLEYPDLDASLRFDPDLPKVWADPDKVEQVLTNLVENACKYARPDGLAVTGSHDGPDAVQVAVADRGQGMPPEDLRRVFTKFFRRAEGRPTGSGLGLWISRGLVEAHGGVLTATSAPGQGTSFAFTLPLVDPAHLQEP